MVSVVRKGHTHKTALLRPSSKKERTLPEDLSKGKRALLQGDGIESLCSLRVVDYWDPANIVVLLSYHRNNKLLIDHYNRYI
jgi:hypothetical protein